MELADDVVSGRCIEPALYIPKTLEQLLSDGGTLSLHETVYHAGRLLGGLGYLHACGVVHRDIKAANVIFVHGQAKLADPGLVRYKGGRQTVICTQNAAPEGPGEPIADLYSFGKLMLEMMPAGNSQENVRLREIALKACEKCPENRYQSAGEVVADLAELERRLTGTLVGGKS